VKAIAHIVLVVAAAGLLAGCAAGGHLFTAGGSLIPTLWQTPVAQYPGLATYQLANSTLTGTLVKYAEHRVIDLADIFEIGGGVGSGLGATLSAGVVTIGAQKGAYTWLGIFGADQIGIVQDKGTKAIGLPFTTVYSASALMQSASLLSRLGGAGALLTGFEDGIGGPDGSKSGYESLGPMGYSAGRHTWTSASFPVGISLALGPVATVSRVRMGAVANFLTGFVGFHLFKSPETY
jgi:hypothetical protein